MSELLNILKQNNIKYSYGHYAGIYDSIIIKKNNYKIEIYETNNHLVSDLQKTPYTFGIMGSTNINQILHNLSFYLKIDINITQLSLF